MYFAFKDQNLAEIFSKLKNIEYSWLLLSMGFGAVAIISRGYKRKNNNLPPRNICSDPLLSHWFFYVAEWQHGNYLVVG